MGFKKEFQDARDWVAKNLNLSQRSQRVSLFELNIRILGGLLGAYELSKDKMFLDKAADLGKRCLPAFDTPTGLPHPQITVSNGATYNSWTGDDSLLAELGTLQLEFRQLSVLTGNPVFRRKVENVYKALRNKDRNGMFPTKFNRNSGRESGYYTFGGLSDSFYEYLLKMWLQGGRTEPKWRTMYDKAIDGMVTLLKRKAGVTYVGQQQGGRHVAKMEHLACFVPGMLALGAHTSADPSSVRSKRDMLNAKALTYTCHKMYESFPAKLSPESVRFRNGKMYSDGDYYILRPEAAESMFVLHSITGHPVFRDWSWRMFEAIELKCKTKHGYGNYGNVNQANRSPDDRAESFFMAETLKYLYMIQLPIGHPSRIDINKFVLNTEAHPFGNFPDGWEAKLKS